MRKLVTVITPTWNRHEVLRNRCIPSIIRQDYQGPLEHLIISDGSSPGLEAAVMASYSQYSEIIGNSYERKVAYLELGRNWKSFTGGDKSYGACNRIVGNYLAHGDYVAYLDDDDEWLPEHLTKSVDLLERQSVDFVYSKIDILKSTGERICVLCDDPPREAYIGTCGIVHRIEAIITSNWTASGYGAEWHLAERWLAAGLKYAFLNEITVLHHRPEGE